MRFRAAFAIPPKLVPIMGMVFVITLGWGMLVPILPLLAEGLGSEAEQSGLFLSAFGAARLITGIPAGAASDRFGRRAIMLAGVILVSIGAFGMTVAWSVPSAVAALCVIGCGSACYVAAALAAVADLSEGGGRGRLMSYYQSGVLAGVSVGPAAGGLLVGFFGIRAPFLALGIVAAIGGIIATVIIRETVSQGTVRKGSSAGLRARLQLLADPPLLAICCLAFGIYCSRVVATWQVTPIIAREALGYDAKTIGLLLTAGALGNFSALPLSGYVIDRFGARSVILGAGPVVLFGLVLVCLPPVALTTWLSVIVLGAAGSTMATACSAFAASVSRAAHGITMGTLRMAGDLGLVTGPIILTTIVTHSSLGLQQAFSFVVSFMGATVVIFWVVGRPRGSGASE